MLVWLHLPEFSLRESSLIMYWGSLPIDPCDLSWETESVFARAPVTRFPPKCWWLWQSSNGCLKSSGLGDRWPLAWWMTTAFSLQVHGSCLDKPPSLLALLLASPGVLMCCLRANIIHTCDMTDAERWASLCVWQKSDSPPLVPGNLVLAHILQSRQGLACRMLVLQSAHCLRQ